MVFMMHLIKNWFAGFLIFIGVLFFPDFIKSQELDHSILLRNHNEPGYDISTRLVSSVVNSKGNLVSLVHSSGGTSSFYTDVEAPNEQFRINANEYLLFESNHEGNITWKTAITFKNLNPSDPGNAIIRFMNSDDNENYYITIQTNGALGVEFNGIQQFRVQSPTLTSSRLTTFKVSPQGQYINITFSSIPTRLHRYLSVIIKNNLIYSLYSRYESNPNPNVECQNLREVIEIRSLDGQLIKETAFSAKDIESSGDDVCTGNTNESFLIDGLDVDHNGNIYLSGHLRGAFSSSLHRSITASADEHFNILVKLNRDFVFQWYRVISSNNRAHRQHQVMESGDVLFYNITNNVPIYKFNKTGTEINTTSYTKLSANLTVSLSKVNPDGNLDWVSFFDRPIRIATDNSNNEQNIWVYIPTLRNRSDAFVYYNPAQEEQSLKNEKYPNIQSQVGYLRLDENGQYIGHRFLALLTNGVRDMMFPTLHPLNVDCKEFYITGRFIGTADISFEQNVETVTSESEGDVVIAKYSNAPPTIEVDNSDNEQCPESTALIPFTVTDENNRSLRFSVASDNQSILPNDNLSIINENGQYQIRVIAGQVSGNFNVILTVTDECDITIEEIIPRIITTPPSPPLILNTERLYNLCEHETADLTTSIDNPLWSNGATTKTITVDQPGLYWAQARGGNGCLSLNSDTVEVVVFRTSVKPIVTTSGPTVLCEGESVILTTNLDRNIVWSNGETTPSITVTESGIYSVYQSSVRCGDGLSSDPIEVIVHPIPQKPLIQVEGNLAFCQGSSVTLTAPSADGVRWSNGSTDQSIVVNQSGEYWLQMEVNGCLSPVSDMLEIMVSPDFNLNLTSDITICTGFEELTLQPQVDEPDVDYLWSDGSTFSTLVVTQAGEYWLDASNGVCEKDRIYVKVKHACYPKVYIPNAFSPNDDGINDTFEVIGIRMISFKMQIFNKWGLLLFETNSLNKQWNGKYKAQDVPSGGYTYKIIYSGEDENGPIEFVKRGNFKLLR